MRHNDSQWTGSSGSGGAQREAEDNTENNSGNNLK